MPNTLHPFSSLSKRELEIVKLIAHEYNNKAIADELEISERTVETHRKNIFRKTGVKTAIGLVILALKTKNIIR